MPQLSTSGIGPRPGAASRDRRCDRFHRVGDRFRPPVNRNWFGSGCRRHWFDQHSGREYARLERLGVAVLECPWDAFTVLPISPTWQTRPKDSCHLEMHYVAGSPYAPPPYGYVSAILPIR